MSGADDALAAAWGAETDQDADEAVAPAPARVLNQAEIDSLLGFENDAAGDESRSGMQRIISWAW